jgi:hypothetical protein
MKRSLAASAASRAMKSISLYLNLPRATPPNAITPFMSPARASRSCVAFCACLHLYSALPHRPISRLWARSAVRFPSFATPPRSLKPSTWWRTTAAGTRLSNNSPVSAEPCAEVTSRRADASVVREQGIVGLRHLKRATATWKLEDGFDLLEPGLKRSFKRGTVALKTAQEHPSADNFHALRKRVKDRWYQVRVLEGIWPHPSLSPEKALGDLQEDLGDDHNLEVLRASIPADSAALLELVDILQKNLREKSLAAATALYNRKPREFVAELKSLWDEWRPPLPAPKTVKSAGSATRTAAIA